MPAPPPPVRDGALQVHVVAPRDEDGRHVRGALKADGLAVETAAGIEPMCEALGDETGAIVLTEESLTKKGVTALERRLQAEPPWSSIPVVVFVNRGRQTGEYVRLLQAFGNRRHVTVLERPISLAAFRSVVRFALMARERQLDVRDLLGRLRDLNGDLQDRVDEQTTELRARAEQVRDLARELTLAEQHERERIAQVLHDDLQQILYGARLRLGTLAPSGDTDARTQEIIHGWLDDAVELTRTLTTRLHPPVLDEDGLESALEWVADDIRRLGLEVTVEARSHLPVPNRDVRVLLTQMVRELLFNVAKHAGVETALVVAQSDAEGLELRVYDGGRGMEEDSAERGTGRGLFGVRERLSLLGGEATVESVPGEGTTVTLRLPAAAYE